jgi:xanthine dehydrogenase accessory factor
LQLKGMKELVVLVLGCGDVGSAFAHRLFRMGVRVSLRDVPHSSHARRGMAFTDALFEGSATLEGTIARHAQNIRAVRQAWNDAEAIPVVTLPEFELVNALAWSAVVDATMRKHQTAVDRRSLAAAVIGLGPGFTPGMNCHVAVETQWGSEMGAVLRDRSTAATTGGPKTLAGVGRERFVIAPASGFWRTAAAIGQRVQAAEVVGTIGATSVRSPFTGSLRGLTHDKVTVAAGQKLVEVDDSRPRSSAWVHGLFRSRKVLPRPGSGMRKGTVQLICEGETSDDPS